MTIKSLDPLPALAMLLLAATAFAAEARPTARDIASLKSIDAVHLSPDAVWVAYTVKSATFDESAKPADDDKTGGWKKETQIHLARVAGDESRQLTFEKEESTSPVWSPDARTLAFLRKADGKTRMRLLSLAGGESREIDTGKLEPTAIAFAPDGKRIAFTARLADTDEERHAKWASGGAVLYDREWRSEQIFVIGLDGGEPRQVTRGTESVVAFRWSPDGRRFAAVLSRSSDPYYTSSLTTPAIVSASDGAIVRRLEDRPGTIEGIEWSPDGKRIAYARGVESLSLLNHLEVVQVDGKGRWNAASKLDPTLGGFVWLSDSSGLIAQTTDKTETRLMRLAYDGSSADDAGFAGRVIQGPLTSDSACKVVAFASSTSSEPGEPTAYRLESRRTAVLARTNPQVADWSIGRQEVVSWTSPEGMRIEGLLMVPARARAGKPTPLMVFPHGGPDSVSTQAFSPHVMYFAARGYSVLRPNYRGGTGYGHDFYVANRGRLGEIELLDIESGVDSLVKSGRAASKHLVYGGWSWGGYLTAWTIGHTGRYRAAVAGAAVVDVVSQYAESDINHGVAAEWEFKGNPWRQWENFDRANPVRFLQHATIPTLILHGESDDRVDFTSSRILYRALADVGCEVEFRAYPREPHSFTEPAHVVDMLEAWADWYARHDK